jgi:hypothetical protein
MIGDVLWKYGVSVIVGVGYLFTGWILNGGYYLMILIQ